MKNSIAPIPFGLFILACFITLLSTQVSFSNAFRAFNTHSHRGALNDAAFWKNLGKRQEKNIQDPPEQWFTQRVNHFDPLDSTTWQQRYFVNDTFYSGQGPIFVLLGGEGPMNANVVTDHFVITDYAKMFNALVVAVEHRFYGKSMPTPDLSLQYLRLLTSQQALADFATFVEYIKEQLGNRNSKVIAFGGSYSGSLSAWFRLKYPHLIDGSVATSAPVKAQLDFPEYNEVVQASLTYFSGSTCAQRVQNATATITQMLATPAGRAKVQSIFNTCGNINTDHDVSLFFSNLEGGIAEVVQYNNDNNKYTPMNINKVCDILQTGSDPIAAYSNFNNQFNKFSGASCTQVSYDQYVSELQDVRPYPANDNAAGRSWTYQTCTEFGYFQTGSSSAQPFSDTISLKWYIDQCRDIFGIISTPDSPMPNIDWTNNYYGSTNLQSSNIVLPNGSIDPWHILGVQTSPVGPAETVIFITGTAHCADLYPPRSTDLPELTQARNTETQLISKWISS